MKYLKSLKLFLEDFQISDTDKPDVATRKKDLNILLKHIKDYNSGKSRIDNILSNSDGKSNSDITKKLNDVIEQGGNRNTFLSQYTTAARMKKQIDNIQSRIINDKIRIDDFKSSLPDASNEDKKSLNDKISDINSRISENNIKINDLKKEISKKEKELKDKMSEKRKELEEKIKNL
jgi:predicted  nucleic acid-binding Zn-ribbon protein